ncbi:290_t:CDS:1, partial [Racocetra persica]
DEDFLNNIPSSQSSNAITTSLIDPNTTTTLPIDPNSVTTLL